MPEKKGSESEQNRSEDKKQDNQQDKQKESNNKDNDNKKQEDNEGSNSKREGSHTSRSSRQSDKSDSDGRKKQKEYFKEELKRLKSCLDREAAKIVAPSQQKYVPYVYNSLEPYYDISTPRYLIELPEQIRHGYVSRQTAIGLCDPWRDHEMDVELLPKIESKQVPTDEKKEKKGEKSQGEKEGSTRLPKFPAVSVATDDITKNRTLYWSDVPMIREELKKKIGANADERVNAEYDRTKKDFYRMELDKMNEYHPESRPKMRATYFAYLQNNSGSKKAVYECVKETEKKDKEKQDNKDKRKQQQKSNNSKSNNSQNQNRNQKQSQAV